MRKITEERFCEVCGVSSKFKKVSFNKLSGKILCEKHREQFRRFGEFKDTNSRGVFDDNEIRLKDNFAEIDTYDSHGNIVETFILDIDDVSKLKGHKWRTVYKNDKPYLFTGNQKKERIYFHRLVLPTDKQVDHISGDTHDNRKCNLREVTIQENMLNLQKKSNNTSGIRGVSFDKKRNKWKTDFTFQKQRYYLMNRALKEEAVYQRYLCEKLVLKNFRNKSNDALYNSYIDKISEERKAEIKEYVINKLNISKERV